MTPLINRVGTPPLVHNDPFDSFSPTTPLAHLALKRLKQVTQTHTKWISSYLNVEIPPKQKKRFSRYTPTIEGLALEQLNLLTARHTITQSFFTHQDFMEMSLYDKDIGYYSTGKVKIGDGEKDHFSTYPITHSPGFGKLAIELAYTMWQAMLAEKDIEPNEPFTILELGAGKGQMAYDMLETASDRARSNTHGPKWKQFYNQLQYCIFEYSPALRALQQFKLAEYSNKVSICEGDARSFGQHFRSGIIKGVVFTNELLDAFPVHNTIVTNQCKLSVQLLIPYLTDLAIVALPKYGIDIPQLLKQSDVYQEKFAGILEDIPKRAISKQDLKKLIQALDKAGLESEEYIEFNERHLSEKLFPEIKKYRKKHLASVFLLSESHASTVYERHPASLLPEELFQKLDPFINPTDKHPAYTWEFANLGTIDPTKDHPAANLGTEIFETFHPACMRPMEEFPKMIVNLGMEQYAKNIAKILKRGFKVEVDYGGRDLSWAFSNVLRTFRYWPLNRSAFTHFAGCDTTADVAWTQFIRACCDFIFQYYGNQRSLGDPVPSTDPDYAEWAAETHFQLLVLKVIGTKATYLPPKEIPSLF